MEQLNDHLTEIHYLRVTEETIEVGLSSIQQLLQLGNNGTDARKTEPEAAASDQDEARLLFYVGDRNMDFRRVTDLRHIRSASHVIIVREFEREVIFSDLRYIILTWLLDCDLI